MYLYKIQSTHLNGQTELSFGGSHYRRMSAPTCAHSPIRSLCGQVNAHMILFMQNSYKFHTIT